MNSNAINRQKQIMFGQRLSEELEKVTLSWSKEMREWYPLAIKALDFTSSVQLKITPENYHRLFESDAHGVNMNIVSFLCNNLEERTPAEMGMTAIQWVEVLKLNQQVSASWTSMQVPFSEKVQREINLMGNPSGIIKSVMGEA